METSRGSKLPQNVECAFMPNHLISLSAWSICSAGNELYNKDNIVKLQKVLIKHVEVRKQIRQSSYLARIIWKSSPYLSLLERWVRALELGKNIPRLMKSFTAQILFQGLLLPPQYFHIKTYSITNLIREVSVFRNHPYNMTRWKQMNNKEMKGNGCNKRCSF